MKKLSYLSMTISLALTSQVHATEQQVLITASKQSQYAASSQNVAAFSVSGSQLEDANIINSKNLAKVLPGLFWEQADSLKVPVISLRGASQGQDFYHFPIQLYVDGVPQSTVAMIQPLGDIANVQLLKGPQGTLYGKYATSGILNIVTQKPDANYRGYISGGYGIRNSYQGKFNISGPVADGILYGSISGLRQAENGRITNPGTGHNNLGGSTDNMGTIRLRLAPDNQPWEINASYNTQCVDSSQGLAIHIMDHDPTKSLGIANPDETGSAPDPKLRRCINSESITGQYIINNWLFSALSSWNQIKFDMSGPSPSGGVRSVPEYWLENIQELRATTLGAGNPIDAVIGVYHHDTRWDKSAQIFNNDLTPSLRRAQSSFIHNQSFSVYTDLTWHITEQLDFGTGLRFSHDTAKTKFTHQGILYHASATDNNVLGQISAGYQLTSQNRIYARIAQGYRPIGYDVDSTAALVKPYKAEKSISYEIGNKYQTDSFHLQGDIFYTNTSDLINIKETSPWNYSLTNLGDTKAWGAEISGEYYFMPGWELGANASLVHSRFTDDIKNNTSYSGRRVPSVPNFTAGVYIHGSITTPAGLITPYIGFNAIGSYTFGDYDFSQKSYNTTDIRIAWQATDRISLSAYVNNVFDKRYFIFADTRYAAFGADYGYANIGRTAGLNVKVELF